MQHNPNCDRISEPKQSHGKDLDLSPKSAKAVLPDQELLNRRQAAIVLGNRSVATIRRMEAARLLTPIKLGHSPSSQTFYRADEVRDLVRQAERD